MIVKVIFHQYNKIDERKGESECALHYFSQT
jgi:hypothetical protein